MPSLPHLLLNFLELRPHAVASGFPFDLELSAAACSADEGEAQKVEGLRFSEPRNAHHLGHWAKAACGGLDPDPAIRARGTCPHLLCSKAASSWLSLLHGSLLFAPSWRTVVRIAHDDHPAGDASLPPPVDPQIVDVVEVDVRQQRADDSALRRPLLRLDQLVFFENPCCQPLADQSYDPAIADAVLDKTDQPILVDRVEERLDIGIEDPVDPPLPDSERERIQCVMLVAPGPEPVAEAQELRFVNGRQDRAHRRLDNLVL